MTIKEPTLKAMTLVEALRGAGQTVALCESLTAGLASALIADVPGASEVLRGGLVTYATDTKESLAGVPAEVLKKSGPISRECAEEMARGAKILCGSDWGLSLTGVAGPTKQDNHPVGEVWIGIADPTGGAVAVRAFPKDHHRWALIPGFADPLPVVDGDRATIRRASAEHALEVLAGLVRDMADGAAVGEE